MRFRTLWNASPDAMVLTDEVGMILAANPSYCALHGYLPTQLDGQSFSVIFPEAARPVAMAHYKAVFESRDRTQFYPVATQLRDPSERLVESRIDFLSKDSGDSVMMSSVRLLPEESPKGSPDLHLPPGAALPTASDVLIDAMRTWGIDIILGPGRFVQYSNDEEVSPPG